MPTSWPILNFLYSQFFITPPPIHTPLTSQTIIITRSSSGLGLSAAQQIALLSPSHIILAVRSPSLGEKAKTKIETLTGFKGTISVWLLDISSMSSIKIFAQRAIASLDRIDAIIHNAGMLTLNYTKAESGDEIQIMVHALGPTYLSLLLADKMRESRKMTGVKSRICIVGSDTHWFANREGWAKKETGVLEDLRREGAAKPDKWNPISKLLIVLLSLQLSEQLAPDVIVNIANPGLCKTRVHREFTGMQAAVFSVIESVLARSSEVGARTLVAGVVAGEESQGRYMSDCVLSQPSDFVRSKEGQELGKRLWNEILKKME